MRPEEEELVRVGSTAVPGGGAEGGRGGGSRREDDGHWTVKAFGGAVISCAIIAGITAFQSAFAGLDAIRKDCSGFATREATGRLWAEVRSLRDENSRLRERVAALEARARETIPESDMAKEKEKGNENR